jgi:hypothetical protein
MRDPNEMTPEECRAEVALIFARGILRHREKRLDSIADSERLCAPRS